MIKYYLILFMQIISLILSIFIYNIIIVLFSLISFLLIDFVEKYKIKNYIKIYNDENIYSNIKSLKLYRILEKSIKIVYILFFLIQIISIYSDLFNNVNLLILFSLLVIILYTASNIFVIYKINKIISKNNSIL